MTSVAMFAGLVTDEADRVLEVAWVGEDACYVLRDGDFWRHIDAGDVDRQVLRYLRTQLDAHRDIAVRGMLEMLGKDDIFTKTALEYSINTMEDTAPQPLPPEVRQMLQSLGFRIVVDYHGDVVAVEMPEAPDMD